MSPLIHVGFPKCGSTWLQKRLFTNEEVGFTSPWGEIPALAIEHLLVSDPFRFEESIPEYRDQYKQGFKTAESKNCVPVISYEHFFFDQMNNKNFIKENAYRMKELFPDAKILLIIREQKSLILSSYMEHLRRGFTTRLERFISTSEYRKPAIGPICNIDLFRYDRIINHLYEVFGKDSVLCLPLEMIKTKPFTDKIFDFCNISPKTSITSSFQKPVRSKRKGDYVFLRLLNHIGHSRYNNFEKDSLLRKLSYYTNIGISPLVPKAVFKKRKEYFKNTIKKHVGDSMKESNRLTEQITSLNLSKLGYDT